MDTAGIPSSQASGQATGPSAAGAAQTPTAPRIIETLRGRTLLLTGTTGFLAKGVLEKILRDLPDVAHIHLLIRPRQNAHGTEVTAEDRMRQEVLTSGAFDRLREEHGDGWTEFVEKRVSAVAGDLSKERLGLDDETYERLTSEVDFVINSAATVTFDERLDHAIDTNTLGPSRLVAFARTCQERRGQPVRLVHISTAYVSGYRNGDTLPAEPFAVGDTIRALRGENGTPPLDIDAEIRLIREETDKLIERSRKEDRAAALRKEARARLPKGASDEQVAERAELLRQAWVKERLVRLGMERAHHYGWNDTYTFTKAMGEMQLVREAGDVSALIVRPSIIESSMFEPKPGWLDGFRMADPIIMGYAKGLMKDIPARAETIIDVIPLDFVVNATIAAMARPDGQPGKVKVYHVATGTVTPLTFKGIFELTRDYFRRNPMMDRSGHPIIVNDCSYPTPEEFSKKLRRRYLAPLKVAGWVAEVSPVFPRKVKARISSSRAGVEQALYYTEIYDPYFNLTYPFDIQSTQALHESLHPEDRKAFPFDVREIDWRHYIQDIHIPGLKYNVLKLGATTGRKIRSVAEEEQRKASEWIGDEMETMQDLLQRSANRYAAQTAVEMERSGGEKESYTFAQLLDACRRVSGKLATWGVVRGDRVVLVGESCPRWGITYMGAVCSGVTVVPVDPQTPPDELGRIRKFTGASLVLATEAAYRKLEDRAKDLFDGVPCLDLGADLEPFAGFGRDGRTPKPSTWGAAGPDDMASIIFTSGTSVDPKAVRLTHRNFLTDAIAVAKVLRPYAHDRFLSVLPMHHVFEFTGGYLVPLLGGSRITYVEALKSRTILDTMQKTRTTVMLGVPRLFEILHDGILKQVRSRSGLVRGIFGAQLAISKACHRLLGRNPGAFLFRAVHRHFGGEIRCFVSGGAALDPAVYRDFTAMGFPLCEGYGLTEASPVLTVNPLGGTKPASVGPPLPGVELRIDDPDEHGVGEIVVRGEMLMQGYLDNEDATQRMLRHGWLHTGDLGYQDSDGFVFITGRSKDLIVTPSGKNVYPDEVETLYRHQIPALKEMCVLGMDAVKGHGEEVHAVVVPDWREWEGERDLEAWKTKVAAAVRSASSSLPTYQRIQKVHYWDEDLPRTQTLKVQRRLVREALLAKAAAPAPGAGPGRPGARSAAAAKAAAGGLSSEERERLIGIVAGISKVAPSQVHPDSTLQFDLGVDSLMRVEMMAALEESFGVRIPDSLAPEMTTVEDVAEIIHGRRESSDSDVRAAYWDRVLTSGPVDRASLEDGKGPVARLAEGAIRRTGRFVYDWYYRLEVEGLEHVPTEGAYLLAANHQSHLDSGAVLMALGERSAGLRLVGAKDYFFAGPFRSWLFKNVFNAIPFDRREHFIEGLRLCRTALEQGDRLLIFPEGTRSPKGDLQPFKAGIGLLAVQLGVPVIPVRIQGTYESLPKGGLWPHRTAIRVAFGEPMQVKEPSTDASYDVYREFADELRRRVEALP